MSVVKINSFGGLATSLSEPPIGSATTLKNLVRYRHRGWLEQPDGYASKYTLPTNSTYMTSLEWKDIHNFYVIEHGGADITVAIGNYTKVSRYDAGVTIPRFGVWIRPYWSGVEWVDDWLELTEIEIVQLTSFSSDSTLNFATTGKATDYFENWIVVFEDFDHDTDNYHLIKSSTASSVTYFGLNSDISTWDVGAKIILCRSFLNKELPTLITSHIFNYLNEIRMTSGSEPTDISLMSGFRKKTYSWSTPDSVMDRMVLDVGCLDVWRYAVLMLSPTAVTETTNPLEAGNYAFRMALGTDDNQIAGAHEAHVGSASPLAIKKSIASASSPIATDGTYIYRADDTDPRIINKYSAKDYTSGTPAQCQITNDTIGTCNIQDMLIMGGNLYVLTQNIPDAYHIAIVKVDLSTFTAGVPIILSYHINNGCLCTDGTYIYVVSPSSTIGNNVIVIVKLSSTLTTISINIYKPDGHTDVVAGICSACYSNGYIYVTTISSTKTSWMMKISTGFADTPLGTASLDLSTHNKQYPSMCVLGSFLYDTYLDTGGAGATIEKRSTTDLTISSVWATTAGTDAKLTTDGVTLYGYMVSTATEIMKDIDVAAKTSANITITNTTINMQVLGNLLWGDGFIIDLSPSTYLITSDGTQRIDFNLLVSAGAIPTRARYVYIYMSKDGAPYYRIKKIDLTVVKSLDPSIVITSQTWFSNPYYETTAKHFYHKSDIISIKDTDVQVIGPEMNVDMGRYYLQSGVVRSSAGGVVGVKTYVGNFYDVYSSQTFKNIVLVNCVSGEGNQQIDVFDYTNPINGDYGDDDEIIAILSLNDRILVLKKRSLVLFTLSGDIYERELVTKNVGCCSQASAVSFDDTVYWADYNGLHSFDGRGLKTLNLEWVEDWKALTTDQKKATCSAIDRVNKLWIVNTRNFVDELLIS